jgi:hypothetical protein
MPELRPPDLPTFARQFKQKYGREMTRDEKRFYELTKNLLDNPPEEEQQEAQDGDGEAA